MKRKVNYQAALLVLLLAVVVGGGIWLFTATEEEAAGSPQQSGSQQESQAPEGEDGGPAVLTAPQDQGMLYRLAGYEEISGPDETRIYFCDGHPCRWTYVGEEEALYAMVSLTTGERIFSYGAECFTQLGDDFFLADVCVYPDGTLWGLFWESEGSRQRMCPITPDVGEDDLIDLGEKPFQYVGDCFLTWGDYAALMGFANRGGYSIVLYNIKTGTTEWIDYVRGVCMDDEGNLYYARVDGSLKTLTKRSLNTGNTHWVEIYDEQYGYYDKLWYCPGVGLFSFDSPTGAIRWIDPETGDELSQVFNMEIDSDLNYTEMEGDTVSFAVLPDFQVVFSRLDIDFSQPPYVYRTRHIWRYEAYTPEIGEPVTLTITAPYPDETISASILKYQRRRPEVEVVWDTQYVSREEFQEHSVQYMEQIALRTMTGDVGDIQMIIGAGLSQDVITDTDAFVDLTDYLAACEFRDELALELLEPLRGEDGAVRALPLGVQPNFLIFNQSLADELGLGLDPEDLTWSQLMDLGLSWQAQGAPYSLFVTGSAAMGDGLIDHILLANLYDLGYKDGGQGVNQPWLRELLVKYNDLQGSDQLRKINGGFYAATPGFFDNALCCIVSGISYSDILGNLATVQARDGIILRLAPMPHGEVSEGRQSYAFCWGIPSSSENQQEAWEFLEFIISSDGMVNNMYSAKTYSINNVSDWERYEQALVWHPYAHEEHYRQLQTIRLAPVSRYDEIYGWAPAVHTPITEYLSGERTLDDALALADENWKRFLLE